MPQRQPQKRKSLSAEHQVARMVCWFRRAVPWHAFEETGMASKAKKVAVKEREKEKDGAPPMGAAETTDALLPLLDLSDAVVKKLIRIAKKRGCVTHDQVKSLSEE